MNDDQEGSRSSWHDLPGSEVGVEDWPSITIITPSFNQGSFIEEAILSVVEQDYPNVEYFVFDGGSSDETGQILDRYSSRIDYWTMEPDNGQTHAINKGFQRAKGEILVWLNSDDFYYPGALLAVAEVFRKAPRVDIVMGLCAIVDREGRLLKKKSPPPWSPRHFLVNGRVPGQPAVFFRRKLVERIGLPSEDLHYVLDWEYWLRASLVDPPVTIRTLDQTLAAARIWPGAKTPTSGKRGLQEKAKVLSKLFCSKKLPVSVARLKGAAFSRLHWQQILLELERGKRRKSLAKMVRLLARYPSVPANWKRFGRFALLMLKPHGAN